MFEHTNGSVTSISHFSDIQSHHSSLNVVIMQFTHRPVARNAVLHLTIKKLGSLLTIRTRLTNFAPVIRRWPYALNLEIFFGEITNQFINYSNHPLGLMAQVARQVALKSANKSVFFQRISFK